jgi:dTDP-4-amino-4,6-dideoxygalactose transaminase
MIFNSLGSNYDFGYVVKSLFGFSDGRKSLKNVLKSRFKGDVELFYKGREAIETALRISRLRKGEYVAVNGFTCYVVYKAIINAGLKVEYLDIDPKGLNFSPEVLEGAIKRNSKIKAVIVQNTLGYSCDIENISTICKKNGIVLIEDLAHSVSTIYKSGKEAGRYGDFIALSFSQDKIIDAVSGGALIIRNPRFKKYSGIAQKNISLILYLKDRLYPNFTFLIRKTYWFLGMGKVFHYLLRRLHLLSTPIGDREDSLHILPNWHSLLARNYVLNLDKDIEHRKKISAIYRERIDPSLLSGKLLADLDRSTNIRFPIFVDKRESLIEYLKINGIHVSDIWYDAPISPKKFIKLTDYKNQCPIAEGVSSKIVNLPTHKNVSVKEAAFIADKINQWLITK